MRRVELFEIIRREAREGASIRSLARRYEVHRRTVRQAIASSIPPSPRRPERIRPALGPEIVAFIEAILVADRDAPRKQRHTALRIYQRVRDELHGTVGESTVRHFVADRRRELGIGISAYVPQHHPDAAQAEVDFYEAVVEFPAEAKKVMFIALRSSSTGEALHRGYPRATQAAFFDGIARGLEFTGGVFNVVRFDNLRSAVARVVKGGRRIEQDRFISFRSHYGFESSFCTPGIEGAHEKGGIEGEVGRFRRRWLTPIPACEDFEALNDYLMDCCIADLGRTITGRGETVGDAASRERSLLQRLPKEPFDVAEIAECIVDAKCRVSVRTNRYSVPARLVGRTVSVRISPLTVAISHGGVVVATHPRLHLKYGEHLELDHYLELLEARPGAFGGSLPLHQERERGSFTAAYDELLARLCRRQGPSEGTRAMIEVLLLHRRHPRTVVQHAVEAALKLGACDPRAVALLCRHSSDQRAIPEPIDVGSLARYDRAMPILADYDLLLEGLRGGADDQGL